ncbi:MAG: archaeosortase/exosortase family protein [Desulfuromonadales bacterium]|nr:archaeosortase/exosortase family protein [Desulfuromonadales bacterium]
MGRKSRLKKEARQERLRVEPKEILSSASSSFLKIAMTFAAMVIVFEIIVELFIDWLPLQLATASITTYLLQVTGLEVNTSGIHMILPNARWEVIADCTAIGAQVIFLSFVLAFPSSKKAKLFATGVGVPFIFAVNIVRLVALGWLTYLSPKLADYCHDFVWQMGFLFMVVGMWLAWIEWVVKREKNPAVSA